MKKNKVGVVSVNRNEQNAAVENVKTWVKVYGLWFFLVSLKMSLSELSHTDSLVVVTVNISKGTCALAVCAQKTKAW